MRKLHTGKQYPIRIRQRPSLTLVELMVAVAIIGILTSIGLVVLPNQRARARNAQRIAGVAEIQAAMESYYQVNGKYPFPEACRYSGTYGSQVFPALPVNHGWNGLASFLVPKYMNKMPNEPFGITDTSPTGEKRKYFWNVVVSGPYDKFQHYIIQVGLEDVGVNRIYNDSRSIVGTIFQSGIVNPVAGKADYGENFHFTNEVSDTNWSPSLENCSVASNYKPLVKSFINCGSFETNNSYWDNMPAGKYHELCFGNVFKQPTRALKNSPASHPPVSGDPNWEDPGDPQRGMGIGCFYKFPTPIPGYLWFDADNCI